MGTPKFPKTLKEFTEHFLEEKACFEYLAQSRWPDGFVCPKCESKKFWIRCRGYVFICKECNHETSSMGGTIMHGSHVPINKWFWAAYLVATHTPGMSATQLQRQMGGSYKTAWFLLHRLRHSMVNSNRSQLYGCIEADETIVGGPVRDKRGRAVTSEYTNTLVFGAVEVITYIDKKGKQAEKAGRIRLSVTERADEISIKQFLTQNIAKGSTIKTDGWKGYSKTALADYIHEATIGHAALHIHRAFGNLKTWINGTYHGVNSKYLQNYLDEFVFRYNRRQTPMAAFQTLLGLVSIKKPLEYEKMTLLGSKG